MTWHTWTARDLTELRDLWPQLLAARFDPPPPSLTAALPWTDEERARADAQALADRDAAFDAHRTGVTPPGQSPAPGPVHVLDAIADITDSLIAAANTVARQMGMKHAPSFRSGEPGKGRGYDDREQPDGRAHWAALWLEDALPSIEATIGEELNVETARLLQVAHQALGDGEHRILLNAVCPWCDGRALFLYPAARNDEAIVQCLSVRECDPPQEQCASRLRGRPLWRWHEFERLSKAIDRHATEGVAA